ncbi:hypothetical protein AOLI_G00112380 [Acnodon oligacanthus]
MMLSDRVMDEDSYSDCSSGVRSALRSAHSPQSPQGPDFSARQRHVQLRTDEQGDITPGSCPRQLARQSVRLESPAQLTNQPHELTVSEEKASIHIRCYKSLMVRTEY